MPVTGPSQLIPTIDDFLRHWEVVNRLTASLGELSVLSGTQRVDLRTLRERLQRGPVEVKEPLLELQLAGARLQARRAPLLAGMRWFNLAVRGQFAGQAWSRVLAQVPGLRSGWESFRAPMVVTRCLWEVLEAELGRPFARAYPGTPWYAAAEFGADFARYEEAWDSVLTAELEVALARAEWALLEERAVAVMKAYGHAVKGRLGDKDRLVASLPQLWPGPRRGERRGRRAADAGRAKS